MTRFWNEFLAILGDPVPGGVPVLLILLFLLTGLVSVLWYAWPAWLPWRWSRGARTRAGGTGKRRRFRWPRLGRLRFRWRWPWRRRSRPATVATTLPDDELPDLPASTFALNADQLAAAGRYAEAVRERLRAIVRDLVERQVLAPVPGWTVTELAAAAGRARPATAGPLRAASELFSDIWYGQRPATADDDRAMRALGEQVRATLDVPAAGVTR
ncbi:DUF4129 domain-containing protein [Micromonospora sp. CPCC 206060]|uniref:DUF4129 domain-containing protein n=1 Tax=Micromonospora sp. CPCC 206060 TaxID=3122406 RepID=UPI002FEE8337